MVANPLTTIKETANVSWEVFQQDYLSREDEYKYEWVDGKIEKTKRLMGSEQLYILFRLRALLKKLDSVEGDFAAEIDLLFAGNHRRPDIAFFTSDQVLAAKKGIAVVPQFVIEIISTNDQMYLAYKKLRNYRAAAVPLVWYIFPELQEIHVYRGKQSQIYTATDSCSADPVLPGFTIQVHDLLA